MDTKISNFQTNLERNFAGITSPFESEIDPKFEKIDTKFKKINPKFEKIDAKFKKIDAKFETPEKDIKHIVVEFKAELRTQLAELKADMVKYETRLVWEVSFVVSVILISLCPTF